MSGVDFYNNKIVLRSVFGPNGSKAYISPVKDPATGRYPEHIRRVNAYGDMVLLDDDRNRVDLIPENQIFEIWSGKIYDLDDVLQKAEWEAIKHAPIIAKDRFERDGNGRLIIDGDMTEDGYGHNWAKDLKARYGSAEFYIERPDVEVHIGLKKREQVHIAESYVYNDEYGVDGRRNMCRILGKNVYSLSDAEVLETLLDLANKKPETIINIYTSSDSHLRILILDALDKNVIRFQDKLYHYGDIILGATTDAVLNWIKDPKNAKAVSVLKREVLPEEIANRPDDVIQREREKLAKMEEAAAKSDVKRVGRPAKN